MKSIQLLAFIVFLALPVFAEKPVSLDDDETIYYTTPTKKEDKTADPKGTSTDKKDEESVSNFRYQQTAPKLQSYTGTVRIVRTSPVAEAFFIDLNQSFVIPKTDAYYTIYNEMLKSQKTKKPVSFMADPKNRVIYSISPEDIKKEGDTKSPSK